MAQYFYRVYGTTGEGETLIEEFYDSRILTEDEYIEECKAEEDWEDYIDGKQIRLERMTSLKEMREAKRMSQSQLASLSGINYRTLQQYEQGNRDIHKASVDTVLKLADVLGVKIEDII